MRGIRGAVTIEHNSKEEIFAATQKMVSEMCRRNEIVPGDIGAAIFSATEDITAAFPAAGARQLPEFNLVPLFDARQMAVENSMPMCIRALMLVDTEKKAKDIKHVYLGRAATLRADIKQD